MKVIEKIRIVKTKKVLQAFQELSIMSKLDSPFLIKLYYAFQSVKFIFLIIILAQISTFTNGFLSWRIIVLQYDQETKIQWVGG